MNSFTTHTGLVVPIYQPNIDTDQIIPKQFLLRVERTGFDEALFYDWRFNSDGSPKADFLLNFPRYEGASILLAGKNFGCGSSREHAPWALTQYGFRAIIAPSFADIFHNNSLKNGLLPVTLSEEKVAELVKRCQENKGYEMTIDLENCEVRDEFGFAEKFVIDEFRRFCMLNGLDDIGLSLQNEDSITKFEHSRQSWQKLE